jgi:hypothetical protein
MRHRTAALQNLAEIVASKPTRQRRGVRQPYAALTGRLLRWALLLFGHGNGFG